MENQTTTFLYVLIAIIVVYYFISRYIWCDEQENFDPSLVPVSSIVTLAKVAQKLVDGNGTLTNPGNLTVTGNLTVSGKVTTNGGVYLNASGGQPNGINIINSPNIFNVVNTANTTGLISDSLIFWKDQPGRLTIVGRKDDNSDYSWPGVNIDGKSSTITCNNATINGGSISVLYNSWLITPGTSALHIANAYSDDPTKVVHTPLHCGAVWVKGPGACLIMCDRKNANENVNNYSTWYNTDNITRLWTTNKYYSTPPGDIFTIDNLSGDMYINGAIRASTTISYTGTPPTDGYGNVERIRHSTHGTIFTSTGYGGNPICDTTIPSQNWYNGFTWSSTNDGSKFNNIMTLNGNTGVLTTKGGLQIGNTTLNELQLIQLTAAINVGFTHPQLLRAIKICSPTYPVVFIDGDVDNGNLFPFKPSEEIPYLSSFVGRWSTVNDWNALTTFTTGSGNDMFDFVLVYPGYSVDCWTSYNYVNDDNSLTPLTYKNNTNNILYWRIENNVNSDGDNILNYGIQLANNGAPGASNPNPVNKISSIKVPKI